ncbi:MAG: ECF transporter S component [Firmicutes bacterium]|jgi:energy-coupling factor transport system substrate-specific component|nr:ECF transporter S component [Bacillota bacterium]
MVQIKNENLRKTLRVAVPFVLMPLVVFAGVFVFKENMYAWITVACVILALILFYASFDKKIVGTRRMVIIAVMTALSVIGRAVFSMIPAFKPITSIVIITAIWIGPESGFLVGSLTAVISNFQFGQGPWTPFQMFAWGMIGLIAGYLGDPLRRSRVALAVYGAFAGIAYSMIMDIWTVLWYGEGFNWSLYLAALATALPYTIGYAVSNVVFLLVLGRPFGEKLQRVKIKYGV